MINLKPTKRTIGAGVIVFSIIPGLSAAADLTDLPDISLLNPYAFYGGNFLADNVQVYGDTAIYDGVGGTDLTIKGASYLYGDLYLGSGATYSGSNLSGAVTSNVDFTAATSQVLAASTALAALTPTATYQTINTSTTLGSQNNIADVQVFNVTTLQLSSGEDITFNGDAGDYYVLNIIDSGSTSASISLGGDATIGNAALAPYLLVNLYDPGQTNWGTIAQINNEIYGTMFLPYGDATFHSVYGAVYSLNNQIKIQSDANLVYNLDAGQSVTTKDGSTTFTDGTSFAFVAPTGTEGPAPSAVDEPSTLWLSAAGLMLVMFSSRLRSQKQRALNVQSVRLRSPNGHPAH